MSTNLKVQEDPPTETTSLLNGGSGGEKYTVENAGSIQTNNVKDDQIVEGTGSLLDVCINMIQFSVGVGIIGLPWSMAGTSIITFLLFSLFYTCINLLSSIEFVLEAANRYNCKDMTTLSFSIPKYGNFVGTCSLVMTLVWCSIAQGNFMVYHADTLMTYMPGLFPRDVWVLISLGLCFLLCVPENLNALKYTSVLGCTGVLYTMIIVYYYSIVGVDKPTGEICTLGLGPGVFSFTSIYFQSTVSSIAVLPLTQSLKNPTRKRIYWSFGSAVVGACVLYFFFALGGYLSMGSLISGDLFVVLPRGIALDIGRACFLVSSLACYPLIMAGQLSQMEHYLFKKYWNSRFRLFCIVVMAVISAISPLLVTDLGIILSICGSFGVLIQLFVPGAIAFFLLPEHKWSGAACAILGVVLVILQYVIGPNNFVDDLACAF